MSTPTFGSHEWLRQTGGIVEGRRKRAAVALQIYRQLPRAAAQRLAAEWWRRRPSKGHIGFDWDTHQRSDPMERLARAAAEQLSSPPMVNHSWRTWVFGCALAERDGIEIDADLLFIAAMLHDAGLSQPTPGRCFTGRGADLAFELGDGLVGDDQLTEVADAVTHHITPGLTLDDGGPLAFYLQAGSALDLGGLRAVHLPVDYVRRACDVWSVDDVNLEAGGRWRAEASAVRGGRADLLQRFARFSTLARLTPIPP